MEGLIEEKYTKYFSKFPAVNNQKSTIILNAEENPKHIFYLKNGYVKMYSISDTGKELTLNIFKPNTFFPGTWAIANIPNKYFYETMIDSEIAYIPVEEFLVFLTREPEVLFDLTKRILMGLDSTLHRIHYLLSANAYTRVCSTLLMCSSRFGNELKNGDIEIQLPLTHKEIANLAGLSRESTSLEMEKLRIENLIDNIDKKIILKDVSRMNQNAILVDDETTM